MTEMFDYSRKTRLIGNLDIEDHRFIDRVRLNLWHRCHILYPRDCEHLPRLERLILVYYWLTPHPHLQQNKGIKKSIRRIKENIPPNCLHHKQASCNQFNKVLDLLIINFAEKILKGTINIEARQATIQLGDNKPELRDSRERRKIDIFSQGLTFLDCTQIFNPWYWKVNATGYIKKVLEMGWLESQNEVLSPYISIIYNHQIEKQAQTRQQMKQQSDAQSSHSNSTSADQPRSKSPSKIAKYRKTFLARAFYKLQRLNGKASQRTQSQWQQFSSPELNHHGCPLDYFSFQGLDQ